MNTPEETKIILEKISELKKCYPPQQYALTWWKFLSMMEKKFKDIKEEMEEILDEQTEEIARIKSGKNNDFKQKAIS